MAVRRVPSCAGTESDGEVVTLDHVVSTLVIVIFGAGWIRHEILQARERPEIDTTQVSRHVVRKLNDVPEIVVGVVGRERRGQ